MKVIEYHSEIVRTLAWDCDMRFVLMSGELLRSCDDIAAFCCKEVLHILIEDGNKRKAVQAYLVSWELAYEPIQVHRHLRHLGGGSPQLK